ncbi:MAG: hypothetical protein MZV70_42035 [Desulfobacterales bacterium]|nr:hypothetical protein [Desulfobacterales bacterium]
MVSEFDNAQIIVIGLGYKPVFIYEKYGEVFQKDQVTVMIDETPIGAYLEIEAKCPDIDNYGCGPSDIAPVIILPIITGNCS